MATCGYSEDLQSQQANAVTIATPPTATPSSSKTAHFLPEIPAASSANQAPGASKDGQDALCSQAPAAQSQKAAVPTAHTQHYVGPDIQHAAVQKSNGQSTSPQYIIVTVTGERMWGNWEKSDNTM